MTQLLRCLHTSTVSHCIVSVRCKKQSANVRLAGKNHMSPAQTLKLLGRPGCQKQSGTLLLPKQRWKLVAHVCTADTEPVHARRSTLGCAETVQKMLSGVGFRIKHLLL